MPAQRTLTSSALPTPQAGFLTANTLSTLAWKTSCNSEWNGATNVDLLFSATGDQHRVRLRCFCYLDSGRDAELGAVRMARLQPGTDVP